MLPAKRKPVKSGILRTAPRVWNRHRKFVRSHSCCVPGCERGPIEFAHVRQGYDAGTGQKPHDWIAISLCGGLDGHHKEQHDIGHIAFDAKYRINSLKLAAEFAKASPDVAMKEAMKEAGL